MKISPSEYHRYPEWLEKTQEIRYRDGNRCRACDSKEKLQIHHCFYFYEETKPYDYPSESLITLCHSCHLFLHKISSVRRYPRSWVPIDYDGIIHINGDNNTRFLMRDTINNILEHIRRLKLHKRSVVSSIQEQIETINKIGGGYIK